MELSFLWYLVVVLSLICFAMLDGFDLGVGLLHLFAKKDQDRRVFLNAIGPVWDGNEVWLVVVAGALFAGFPSVFATIFSAFYLPVMVFLMGLIFRAVSIEFRSKRESKIWRHGWDFVFAFGSLVISVAVGIFLGNLIHGLPLDQEFNFVGQLADFFHPYALLVALMTTSLFAMHGSIFLTMKTEGQLHNRVRRWVPWCVGLFIFTYGIVTAVTVYSKGYMVERMLAYPIFFLLPLIALAAIFSVPFLMRRKRDGWAFLSSCFSIAALLSLAALGTYPYMVRSTIDPETNSLTIANSSSSALTLKILLIIVAIGVPLVLAYGFYIYRIFRGKVKIDASSY